MEEFLDILCKILANECYSDYLIGQIKFSAISSITNIVDLSPNIVGHLLNVGLIKGLTKAIQQSFAIGETDLTVDCIKTLEKVTPEAPGAVLKSGAIPTILQSMDFFDSVTQSKVFSIITRYAGASQSVDEFNEHILPLVPTILMNMDTTMIAYGDTKKLEEACKIFEAI